MVFVDVAVGASAASRVNARGLHAQTAFQLGGKALVESFPPNRIGVVKDGAIVQVDGVVVALSLAAHKFALNADVFVEYLIAAKTQISAAGQRQRMVIDVIGHGASWRIDGTDTGGYIEFLSQGHG